MDNEFIANIDNISYMYPRSVEPVLKDINLKIKRGEILGIIGPTGAGKSTLCLTLNAVVPQFYGGRFFGKVEVIGIDTLESSISHLSKHVGMVFEDPETQLVTSSVKNEIAFPMENYCFPKDEIIKRIPEVLAAVRLEGTDNKHPQELSGGQKQRLAIASALAYKPDLLILDEPTSQLDPIGTREVFNIVKELNHDLGMTIIIASHASEEMAEYSDRLAILSNGKLLTTGEPNEIYSDVELLIENSLRPPQVATTFYLIKKRQVPVNKIPVLLNDGYKEIENLSRISEIKLPSFSKSPKPDTNFPLFSIKDLKHTYIDGTEALHGITLDIHKGEYVLIIGQNGAGKSTLVKHFLKLLEPTEGSVKIEDVDIRSLSVSSLARRIGYVAQNPDNQIFNKTVGEEVSFALRNLKFSKEEINERTTESLDAMGLLDSRDAHPLSLPKGDRARVVIAAILALKPEIIIFDEPTTGQDFKGASYILDITKQLHNMGKTIIVITHHLYLMPEYAERVIIMGKGTILLDAPIRDAYNQTDLLQSTYLSPPQAVLLSKEIMGLKGEDNCLLTPTEVADCFQMTEEKVNL